MDEIFSGRTRQVYRQMQQRIRELEVQRRLYEGAHLGIPSPTGDTGWLGGDGPRISRRDGWYERTTLQGTPLENYKEEEGEDKLI